MAAPARDFPTLLAAAGSLLRPTSVRLDVDLAGGSTRRGGLRVTLTNSGSNVARGLRLEIHWADAGGAETLAATLPVDDLPAGDVRVHLVTELHRALPEGAADNPSLRVRLRAWNAWPRAVRLDLRPRKNGAGQPDADASESGVAYRIPACPGTPGGAHRFERHALTVDGVVEQWDACANCDYAKRIPLSPEDEARQRAARDARRRREAEREAWEAARRAREARARGDARRRSARGASGDASSPPDDDDDDHAPDSLAWAFATLGVDPVGASWDEVVAAHRRLALEHHPDRMRDAPADRREAALRRMQDVNRARDLLRKQLAPA